MKKSTAAIVFVLFLGVALSGFSLEPVKRIGGSEDNYLFYKISGAVLSKAKDIYILDFKGNFLARYSWEGKFIKKIGRHGQGPGDFNGPGFLDIWQDHLYFFDGRNVRIASVDLALDEVNYYKLYDGAPFTNNFYAIGPRRFIGVSLTPVEEEAHNRIKVIDTHSYSTYCFFDETPVQINTGRNLSQKALYMGFYLNPKFGIDKDSGRILISFLYPNNPVDFFLYSAEGKYLDQFQYEVEKPYTFPLHLLDFPVKYPSVAHMPLIGSILVYKGHFFVFLTKLKYQKKIGEIVGCDCLIFDGKTGNPEVISVDKNLNPFFISEDGYLLASKDHDETERLYIYKLEF